MEGMFKCEFLNCDCWICIVCGDGVCGMGEDFCICLEDCGLL